MKTVRITQHTRKMTEHKAFISTSRICTRVYHCEFLAQSRWWLWGPLLTKFTRQWSHYIGILTRNPRLICFVYHKTRFIKWCTPSVEVGKSLTHVSACLRLHIFVTLSHISSRLHIHPICHFSHAHRNTEVIGGKQDDIMARKRFQTVMY